MAPEWKGFRNGLKAVMAVDSRANSIAASVTILAAMLLSVGA
jgi:hypothetical protein